MSDILALFGGQPVRQKPYAIHNTIIDDAEEKQVIEVLRGGHLSGFSGRAGERFLGGEKVRELEKLFAQRFNVKHAVSFNSATSALHGAIVASGISPGDEVITSPFTMSATASAVLMHNAVPVFADIENETYGLDPQSVIKKITPRTKVILTVNLYGHASRLPELKKIADENGLVLLEDNAQSPGALCYGQLTGTVGKIGILSLNYHKAIQTGEGGIALTNDDQAALRLQLIRNHGEVVVGDIGLENEPSQLGWNYRLTELQAAVGIPQLAKLDRFNAIRQELAEALTQGLREYDFISPPLVREGHTHVYYLFPMRFFADQIGLSRATFIKAMQAEGIMLAGGYVKPLYWLPMYQKKLVYGKSGYPLVGLDGKSFVSYEKGLCPVTEDLHQDEIMITDICKYPNTIVEVEEFLRAIKKVVSHRDRLQQL